MSATTAFKAVHGDFRFTWSDTEPGNAGLTHGKNHVTFYSVPDSPHYIEDHPGVVTHELGHAFDWSVCGSAADCDDVWDIGSARNDFPDWSDTDEPLTVDGTCCLGRDGHREPGRNQYWGFKGGWEDWQFGMNDGSGEIWADMFLGWTYGQWGSGPRGSNRRNYMDTVMPVYLNNIVSYP